MRITRCKTYKGGMAQREMNNKTIRHYCQPGKLIYYISNRLRVSMSQRGKPVSLCLLRIRDITMYILRQGLFKVGMHVKTTNITQDSQ
jgi:hypothetical protein